VISNQQSAEDNLAALMLRFSYCILALVTVFGASRDGLAQDRSAESVDRLLEAHDQVGRLGPAGFGLVWPGFRPDTIPVLYVLPEEGTLLVNWGDSLPDGFTQLAGVPGAGWLPQAARGAASTGSRLGGRGVAQVVVHDLAIAPVFGLTVHESFHVYQGSIRREGRRFGRGENSFLVSSYPIFDVQNEAAFALEGIVLGAALSSESDSSTRQLAQEFLAVREARQRRMDPDYVEFEALVELNEGLAQYAAVRALLLLADKLGAEEGSEAREEAGRLRGDLDQLITDTARSFRLRFYRTGPAIALLSDRLAGESWKVQLASDDLTLQEALAEVSGYRERETALRQQAEREFEMERVSEIAMRAASDLRDLRRAEVDSALSRPGVQLMILTDVLPGGNVGLCGMDPQNLLQVDEGVLFHTRWVRLCSGSALQAEFTTQVLQDRKTGILRAIIGPADEVKLTVAGVPVDLSTSYNVEDAEDVEIESSVVTLRSARAAIEYDGAVLRVRPLPN